MNKKTQLSKTENKAVEKTTEIYKVAPAVDIFKMKTKSCYMLICRVS